MINKITPTLHNYEPFKAFQNKTTPVRQNSGVSNVLYSIAAFGGFVLSEAELLNTPKQCLKFIGTLTGASVIVVGLNHLCENLPKKINEKTQKGIQFLTTAGLTAGYLALERKYGIFATKMSNKKIALVAAVTAGIVTFWNNIFNRDKK